MNISCVHVNSKLVDKTIQFVYRKIETDSELRDYMVNNHISIERDKIKRLLQMSLSSEKNSNDNLSENEIVDMTVEHFIRTLLSIDMERPERFQGTHLLPKVVVGYINKALNNTNNRIKLYVTNNKQDTPIRLDRYGRCILDNTFSFKDMDVVLQQKPYLKDVFTRMHDGLSTSEGYFADDLHFKLFMGLMAVEFTKNNTHFNKIFDNSALGVNFNKSKNITRLKEIYDQSVRQYMETPPTSFMRNSTTEAIKKYGEAVEKIQQLAQDSFRHLVTKSTMKNRLFKKVLDFMGYDLTPVYDDATGSVIYRPFTSEDKVSFTDMLTGLSAMLDGANRQRTAHYSSEDAWIKHIANQLFDYNKINTAKHANREIYLYDFSTSLMDFFAKEHSIMLFALQAAIKNNNITSEQQAIEIAHKELKELHQFGFERATFNFTDVSIGDDLSQYEPMDTLAEIQEVLTDVNVNEQLTIKQMVTFAVKKYKEKGNDFIPALLNELLKNNRHLENIPVKITPFEAKGRLGQSSINKADFTHSEIRLNQAIPNAPLRNISVEDIFFHELVHIATMANMTNELEQQTADYIATVKKGIIDDLRKKGYNEQEIDTVLSSVDYKGLDSVTEFFAELFRSPSLAKAIDQLNATGKVELKQNFFTKLLDLLAKLFHFRKQPTALTEAKQLLSDALTLNSTELLNATSNYIKAKEQLRKAEMTSSVSRIYNFITNRYTGDYLNELFNDLLETYRDNPEMHQKLLNTLTEQEIKNPLTYSGLRLFIGRMAANNGEIMTESREPALTAEGLLTNTFKKAFRKWLTNEKNLNEFLNAKEPVSTSNLRMKEKALYIVDGMLLNLPLVYVNNNTYVLYRDEDGSEMLIPLGTYNSEDRKNIPVELVNGVLWYSRFLGKEGIPLVSKMVNYHAPAIERMYNTTKQEQLMIAYNKDTGMIEDCKDMLLDYVIEIIDGWQEELPGLSRDEVINSHTFNDIYAGIMQRLNSNLEIYEDAAYQKIIDNLDAFIDVMGEDLRITEGIIIDVNTHNPDATNEAYVPDASIRTFESIQRGRLLSGNKREGKKEEQREAQRERIDETISNEDLIVDEQEDEEDNEEKSVERYLMRANSTSVFDRTSMLVKRKLYNLHYSFGHPRQFNDFGHLRRVPFEESKNAIIEALHGIRNSSEMVERLTRLQDKYPFFDELIDAINTDPYFSTNLYNSFNLWTVEAGWINPIHENPFHNLSTDESRKDTLNSWQNNIVNGIVINPVWSLYESKTKIDPERLKKKIAALDVYVNEYVQLINELATATIEDKENRRGEIYERIQNIYAALGVNIDLADINLMYYNPFRSTGIFFRRGMLKSITDLPKLTNDLMKRDYAKIKDWNINTDMAVSLKGYQNFILKHYRQYIPVVKENFIMRNGKGHYLERQSSYLATIFKGIKNFNGDQESLDRFFNEKFDYPGLYALHKPVTFYKNSVKYDIKFYSRLLNELYNNPDVRENFTYASVLDIDGVEWGDITGNKLLLGRYKAFTSGGNKAKFTFFQVPTLSDSPELGFIKLPKYTDNNYKKDIIGNLTNLAKAELNRINFVRRHVGNNAVVKFKNFDRFDNEESNGEKFVMFPFLEPHKKELLTILNSISEENSDSVEGLGLEQIIGDAIETYLDKLSASVYEQLKDAPEIDVNVAFTKEMAMQYTYNDYNATAEILNLLGIDPAFYKNAVDFQKRFKQVYASGVPLDTNAKIYSYAYNKETNSVSRKSTPELVGKETRRTLVLKDISAYSIVNEQLIKALEKSFPNYEQRKEIANKLGVYNRVDEAANHYYDTVDEQGNAQSVLIEPMNITDGQTLISLDEARAVHTMSSNWSEAAERGYVLYKETGDEKYLSEWMNNVKSFYYSDNRVPTGDTIVPFIKDNVQFKHAEKVQFMYKLVKESPILAAITEFLNDTDTVDAISFESTQKVGVAVSNLVDINGLSADEVKSKLYEAVKNKQYVTTTYENWVIQQPTKNKISNNKTANDGSQKRRIIIGNIKDGARFKIKEIDLTKTEFIDTYNRIINEQVKRSFEVLQREFSDNRKLSNLLKRAVRNNKRYHKDLLNAFELDAMGNFRLPLFNPQNSILVQEMLMSIIKKTITKRKVRGGKVVNVSNIGYQNDLKMQFDEDGNLSYFEAYMPWYGTMEEYLAIHNDDGSLDTSKIDDKMLTALTYRIPTEDLYSIIPIRIKGFLPPAQGTNIILPSEILALTGLDFDIDTMSLHLYDYKAERNEEGNITRLTVKDSIFDKISNNDFINWEKIDNFDVLKIIDNDRTINYRGIEQAGRAVIQGKARLDTFSLEEEKGSIAGGSTHVEATLLLGADERTNEKERRNSARQEELLTEYAQEKGVWLSPNSFGELINEGDEAKVYPSEREGYVVKVYDYKRFSRTPLDFLNNRITLHNHFAPDTAYTLKGFTTTENFMGQQTFAFVVEQPFVQGSYISPSEREKVFIPFMEKMGFKYTVENHKPVFYNDNYIIRDLHDKNILLTKENNIRFIDTVIELNTVDSKYKGVREYGKGNIVSIDRQTITPEQSQQSTNDNIKNNNNFEVYEEKRNIRNVLYGNERNWKGNSFQAISNYLRGDESPSASFERRESSKEQERAQLEKYINEHNLWYKKEIRKEDYIDAGAEQEVYRLDERNVIKLNSLAFYNSWVDYFDNLSLHNHYFSSTAYSLEGFIEKDNQLFAVIKQPFVKGEKADMTVLEEYLLNNGFKKRKGKKTDYENTSLGLIIEDLHDENIITVDGIFFFLDTVFYTTPAFFENKEDIFIGKENKNQLVIFDKTSELNNAIENSSKEELDNSLLDMAFARMLHSDSTAQRLNPGGFDHERHVSANVQLIKMGYTHNEIKDLTFEEKEDLINAEARDLNSPLTHAYFTEQNARAAGNIGKFANAKSFKNLVTSLGRFKIIPKNEQYYNNLLSAARLLGLEDFSLTNLTFTDENGIDIEISKELASDVAASVDAVKDPVHPTIGVTNDTIDFYTGMRLLGVDLNKIAYFMNLNGLKEGLKAAQKTVNKYDKNLDMIFESILPDLTLDMLSEMINRHPEEVFEKYFGKARAKDLTPQFFKMLKIVQDFGQATKEIILSTRFDSTNAAPKDSFSKMQRTVNQHNILFNNSDGKFMVELSDDFTNSFVETMFNYSYKDALNLLERNMNTYAQQYLYKLNPTAKDKEAEKVVRNAYIDYIWDNVNDDMPIKSEEFVRFFPAYFLTSIRNSKYVEFEFFKRLGLNNERTKNGQNRLMIITNDTINKDVFIQDWMKMYRDPAFKQLALQLAAYAIKTQGFEFNSKHFSYLIPSEIMMELANFDALYNEPAILNKYLQEQAMLNNAFMNAMGLDKIFHYSKNENEIKVINDFETALQSQENNKYKSIGINKTRYYKLGNKLLYVDFDNSVKVINDLIAELKQKHQDMTIQPSMAYQHNGIVLSPSVETDAIEQLMDNDTFTDMDDISLDDKLEAMIYDSTAFNDMKQIENLRDTFEAFEQELHKLYESMDKKYERLENVANIGKPLNDDSLLLFELPQFAGMDNQEIMEILDDVKRCNL